MPVNFQKISATNVVEVTNKKFMTDAEKSTIAGLGTASTLNSGTLAGNVPVLDAGGKLSGSILPDLAVTDVFVVATQSAMLALSQAKTGDIAIRTDLSKSFILSTLNYGTLADWKELSTPTSPVTSVNSLTGAVVIGVSDISGLQTSLDNKLDDSQLDTNTGLGGGSSSDTKVPSQKAVKSYVDTSVSGISTSLTSTVEDTVVSSVTLNVSHTIKGVVSIYSNDEGILKSDSYTYVNSAITLSDTSMNGKTLQVTYLY
jgi:hypothetical protein